MQQLKSELPRPWGQTFPFLFSVWKRRCLLNRLSDDAVMPKGFDFENHNLLDHVKFAWLGLIRTTMIPTSTGNLKSLDVLLLHQRLVICHEDQECHTWMPTADWSQNWIFHSWLRVIDTFECKSLAELLAWSKQKKQQNSIPNSSRYRRHENDDNVDWLSSYFSESSFNFSPFSLLWRDFEQSLIQEGEGHDLFITPAVTVASWMQCVFSGPFS